MARGSWMRWALGSALFACGSTLWAQDTPPPIQREMRAAWTATVANIDWPSSSSLTTAQQQAEIITILDRLKSLKMNVVLVQMRTQCDALYAASVEPWSQVLRGTMGVAPSPYYDPLAFWIQEARLRGIEVHAWINPYRARSGTSSAPAPNHVTNTHPHMIRTYGSNRYIDPGHPEALGYIQAAIADIVARYDVDGIAIDDYFYPYPITGQNFPDDETYNLYLGQGGTLSRADWRRQNVNNFIQSTYQMIKTSKPWVKFGIGPFGIWRPNNPPGVTGLDAYASLYADSKKWLNMGWCDYFSPQLYWRIDSTGQPYEPLLNWWTSQNTQGRIVAPSNAIYQVGSQGSNWPVSEIINQINITRANAGAKGNVMYSMKVLRDNRDNLSTTLQNTSYAAPALIPAFTWLDNTAPPRPILSMEEAATGVIITMLPRAGETPRWWTVYTRYGNTWSAEILPLTTNQVFRPFTSGGQKIHSVYVGAVDRCGNESAKSLLGFLGGWDG